MSKTSQSQLLVDQRWLGNITSKRGNRWRGKYKLWTLLTFITALIVVSYLTIKQDCDQKPLTIPSMSYVPESDKRLGFCCGRLNERLGQRSGVIDTRSPLPSLPSNIKKLVSWLVIKPGDSQSQHIQNSNRSANVIPNERIETKTSSNFCFHVQNSSRSANMIPNEQIETKTSSNFCFLRIEPSNMEVDTPPSSPVKSVESSPSQDNSSQKIVDLTNSSPTKSSKNAQKLEESPENKKPNPQQNLLQRRC